MRAIGQNQVSALSRYIALASGAQASGRVFLRAPFSLLYNCMFRYVRNHYGIEVLYTVKLGRRVVFEHQSGIVITSSAVIGDDCIIHQGVTLGIRDRGQCGGPILGNRVTVGAGAKILGNVIVADDAKVGANAVVLEDVPAGATVVGIPAKVVRTSSSPRIGCVT